MTAMIEIPDQWRGEARELLFLLGKRDDLFFDHRVWRFCSDWRLPMGCMYGNRLDQDRSWLCRCDAEFGKKAELIEHVAKACHFGKRVSMEVKDYPYRTTCNICDQVFAVEIRRGAVRPKQGKPEPKLPEHTNMAGERCNGSPDWIRPSRAREAV